MGCDEWNQCVRLKCKVKGDGATMGVRKDDDGKEGGIEGEGGLRPVGGGGG